MNKGHLFFNLRRNTSLQVSSLAAEMLLLSCLEVKNSTLLKVGERPMEKAFKYGT